MMAFGEQLCGASRSVLAPVSTAFFGSFGIMAALTQGAIHLKYIPSPPFRGAHSYHPTVTIPFADLIKASSNNIEVNHWGEVSTLGGGEQSFFPQKAIHVCVVSSRSFGVPWYALDLIVNDLSTPSCTAFRHRYLLLLLRTSE